MKLTWQLLAKGMTPHQQVRNKLQQKVIKLQTLLSAFPEDAVHLHVGLHKQPRKPLFQAQFTLRLPSNLLHAEKTAADPIKAVDQAFRVLLREIGVLKSELRHERDWKGGRRSAGGVSALFQHPAIAA